MSDYDKVQYWIEMAGYDYETSKAMLNTKRYLYVGFMCHQTIEKIIKAVLVSRFPDQSVPYIHNLTKLAKSADIYKDMEETQKDILDTLEPLNIEARYPIAKTELLASLSFERCEKIITETEELFLWIKNQL